jgi:hypothetical protein
MRTLIVSEMSNIGAASQAAIANKMGCSIKTVSRRLSDVPKIKLAFWSEDIQKIGRYDTRRFHARFKRQSGKDLYVRMGCCLYLDDLYVIASKRALKKSISMSKAISI